MLASYARWWKTTGRAHGTLVNYRYTLRRLAAHLGGEDRLASATRDELEDFLAHRMDEVAAGTVHCEFRAIRSFYGWLAADGEIEVNPTARLHGPKVVETPVAVAEEIDYKRLLASCPKTTATGRRDAVVIGLLWWTGMRRGEICSLDVAHVDLDAAMITIPKSKTGSVRRVPVHPELAALLDRHLRQRGFEPGPLIVREHGGRMKSNGLGQMIERHRVAAGVTVSAHAFRRALATRWLRAGGSEVGLRSVAGWKSPEMVSRYTRMSSEELAHAEFQRLMA